MFNFLADCQNIHNLIYSPMIAVFIIKFGPDRMKTVAFCNFQPHMVVLKKFSKCHSFFFILADCQKQLQTEFSHDQHNYNKICQKLNENWGEQ